MKRLVIEFEDDDSLGMVSSISNMYLDSMPCNQCVTYNEHTNIHSAHIGPYRINISISKDISKDRDINRLLDNIQKYANMEYNLATSIKTDGCSPKTKEPNNAEDKNGLHKTTS